MKHLFDHFFNACVRKLWLCKGCRPRTKPLFSFINSHSAVVCEHQYIHLKGNWGKWCTSKKVWPCSKCIAASTELMVFKRKTWTETWSCLQILALYWPLFQTSVLWWLLWLRFAFKGILCILIWKVGVPDACGSGFLWLTLNILSHGGHIWMDLVGLPSTGHQTITLTCSDVSASLCVWGDVYNHSLSGLIWGCLRVRMWLRLCTSTSWAIKGKENESVHLDPVVQVVVTPWMVCGSQMLRWHQCQVGAQTILSSAISSSYMMRASI